MTRTWLRRAGMDTVATLAVMTLVLAGCSARDTAPPDPVEIASGTSCSLDGMLLTDYPGPKAQIFYAGQEAPEFFCDTVEMFNVYLNPEQVKEVRAVFVQDMGKASWDEPRGHWIDAQTAAFVVGGQRHGSMGPTIASFALEADAKTFAAEYGGEVVPFAGVTADKVRLDGGALHDGLM